MGVIEIDGHRKRSRVSLDDLSRVLLKISNDQLLVHGRRHKKTSMNPIMTQDDLVRRIAFRSKEGIDPGRRAYFDL